MDENHPILLGPKVACVHQQELRRGDPPKWCRAISFPSAGQSAEHFLQLLAKVASLKVICLLPTFPLNFYNEHAFGSWLNVSILTRFQRCWHSKIKISFRYLYFVREYVHTFNSPEKTHSRCRGSVHFCQYGVHHQSWANIVTTSRITGWESPSDQKPKYHSQYT